MSPDVVPRLAALRPAIKAEWTSLLRAEPALSPMGHPDTLVFLMDETLDQLAALIRTRPSRPGLARAAPVVAPLQRRCPCGLNPLLNYYATGELAVRAAARTLLAADLEELLACFHLLAQREIDTLCSVCRHRHEPYCRDSEILSGSAR